MNIKDFFSFKKNFFFWGNLLAMVVAAIALIVGSFIWLGHYTRHDVSVTVPDVMGLQYNEAKALLAEHKLVAVISDSTYNTSRPGGIVLDMTPVKGSVVKDGRMVYLTINTSRPPMRIIPNLIDNSSLREAEAKLLAMGFKLTPNDSVPGEADWIYGIKHKGAYIENGDELPIGSTLTLEVGSGEYDMNMGFEEDSSVVDVSDQEATVIDDSWFE